MRKSAALSTIEELAHLPEVGADGMGAVRSALCALHPLHSVTFQFCNPDANPGYYLADDVLDIAAARRFYKFYYDTSAEDDVGGSCPYLFNRNINMTATIDLPLWHRSDLYNDLYRPRGISHLIRLLFRDGLRPIGILHVGISPNVGTERPLVGLRSLFPVLRVLSLRMTNPVSVGPTQAAESATWIATPRGKVKFASEGADDLLRMIFPSLETSLGIKGAVGLSRIIHELGSSIAAGRPARISLKGPFGIFDFEARHLQGRTSRAADVLFVRVTRFVPVKTRVFQSARYRALPRREKQTVLALIDGAPTAELASSLNVTPATARTWIQSLYNRFSVNRRSELINALLADV